MGLTALVTRETDAGGGLPVYGGGIQPRRAPPHRFLSWLLSLYLQCHGLHFWDLVNVYLWGIHHLNIIVSFPLTFIKP